MKSNVDNNRGLYITGILLMSLLSVVFGVWSIVEFILYLVKDNPFNWIVLILAILAFIGELIFFLTVIYSE